MRVIHASAGNTLAAVPLGENRPLTAEEAEARCTAANATAGEMGIDARYVVAEDAVK